MSGLLLSVINCRVCFSPLPRPLFSSVILRKVVYYYDCSNCGYVQTQEPDWLDEAYASPINQSDTGIMVRSLSNVPLVLATLRLMRKQEANVVDYAGGHGILVRLLRDAGVNALWADLYSKNLLARGFEYSGCGVVDLVTAFEAFEHFSHPLNEIRKLVEVSRNILVSTELIASPAPHPSDWWYYGIDHGQHVGFFRLKTLKYIALKFNLNLLSDGVSVHFFTERAYSYNRWMALRYLGRRVPRFLRLGLKPKTWTDYENLSRITSSKQVGRDL